MCVSHKCKSPFHQKPRHGAQGGVLRHPPLCSVFTILFSLVLISFIVTPTHASADGIFMWGSPLISERAIYGSSNGYTLEEATQGANAIIWVNTANGKYRMSVFFGLYQILKSGNTYTLNASNGYTYTYNEDGTYHLDGTARTFNIHNDYYITILPPGINFPGVEIVTPTPIATPIPDYYNGFGNQDTPKGLKGWLKDLWSFLTDPEDYGTIQVGEGDTLIYSTPTPVPTPTPYVQQQQIINPNTGEVVYKIETNIENSTSQVYPTDYVWLDDVPDTVPHEFDLNFSVSGTPTEYTTDLNFSETSDAFIDTVSGVSDGVNSLGSLLGAMPIEIIIYPIVAFCIWAIFAFIHRLLG